MKTLTHTECKANKCFACDLVCLTAELRKGGLRYTDPLFEVLAAIAAELEEAKALPTLRRIADEAKKLRGSTAVPWAFIEAVDAYEVTRG